MEAREQLYDRIQIGGKKYVKSDLSSKSLSEELKRSGSFVNIMANMISLAEAPGQTASLWR